MSEYPTMAVHTRACYLSIYCQVFGYSDYTHQAYCIAVENKAALMFPTHHFEPRVVLLKIKRWLRVHVLISQFSIFNSQLK